MNIELVAAGALTGLLVGVTGVGGGALMTPLLLLVFGINPLVAVGTDLWFAAVTKLFAGKVHHHHDLIDWVVARRLWMGSITAAALTLLWMKLHPISAVTVGSMKVLIAIAVIATGLAMAFQKPLHDLGWRLRTTRAQRFKAVQPALTVASGALIGMLVTLTSVGAGALGAVFLTYLYPLRLTPPRLVATDIVHAIPLAVFAGLGHLMIGNIDLPLLGNLLLGSVPAVVLGAMLSARLPHGMLRTVLAVVLLLIGAKLAMSLL